jgi:hypothetical protein
VLFEEGLTVRVGWHDLVLPELRFGDVPAIAVAAASVVALWRFRVTSSGWCSRAARSASSAR